LAEADCRISWRGTASIVDDVSASKKVVDEPCLKWSGDGSLEATGISVGRALTDLERLRKLVIGTGKSDKSKELTSMLERYLSAMDPASREKASNGVSDADVVLD